MASSQGMTQARSFINEARTHGRELDQIRNAATKAGGVEVVHASWRFQDGSRAYLTDQAGLCEIRAAR